MLPPSFPPRLPVEADAWKSTHDVSEVSIQELRDVRCACMMAMKELDERIAVVTLSLVDLENERQSQALRISQLDAAMAPIRKLQPELLSLIFEYTHGDARIHIDTSVDEESDPRGPVRDTHPERVCRLWRDVALSTPYLFHRLSIYICSAMLNIPDSLDSLVKSSHGIMRRGTRCVLLDLSVDAAEDVSNQRATENVIERLLLPFSSQIEALEVFHSSAIQATVNHLASLLSRMPALKRFEETLIDPNNYHTSNMEETLYFALPSAVVLQETAEPWCNLTSLSIGAIDDDVYLSVGMAHCLLKHCRNLQSCILCVSTVQEGDPDLVITGGELRLNDLVTLHLFLGIRDKHWTPAKFLQPLALPSLVILTFRCWEVHVELLDIVTLIDRSSCRLHSFALYDSEAPSFGDLEPLLDNLPYAKNVAVPNTIMEPALIKRIADGELLPSVQDLTLRFLGEVECNCTAINDLVSSRWENGRGTDLLRIRALHQGVYRASRESYNLIAEECLALGRLYTLENATQTVIATKWVDSE